MTRFESLGIVWFETFYSISKHSNCHIDPVIERPHAKIAVLVWVKGIRGKLAEYK